MHLRRSLSEVTRFLSRGISPKYDESGIAVINQRCIREQRIDLGNIRFSNERRTTLALDKFVRLWDGVINSTGVGTLGRVAQILRPMNRTTVDSHVTIVRPDLEHLDGRYFGFALFDAEKHIETLGVGATGQTELSRERLSEVMIPVPPLSTQRKIASILSAYDDLIENNLRRIKILEEMAQNLYREWFVKFRFPGHEKARFVDSPLGKIPEGWEVKAYSDLLESTLGGDWGVDEPDDKEHVPVMIIRGTDFDDIIKGATLRTPRRFIAPSSLSKRQLRAGDLLVENSINAKSRCVGTTLLITEGILRRVSEPLIAASFCKVYRFKDNALAPLAHLHMQNLYVELKMAFYQNVAANGIGNFQSQRFVESEHLVAPADLRLKQTMLSILRDLNSSILADQVFTLRRTRDLLLPKLISGEVDVSELDIEIPRESDSL